MTPTFRLLLWLVIRLRFKLNLIFNLLRFYRASFDMSSYR